MDPVTFSAFEDELEKIAVSRHAEKAYQRASRFITKSRPPVTSAENYALLMDNMRLLPFARGNRELARDVVSGHSARAFAKKVKPVP